MSTAVIEVSQLCKQFGNAKALDRVSLKLDAGMPIGLVGPNGAGKTTFFSLLCGFLRPTSGRITVLGETPPHKNLYARIGILPQDAALIKAVPIHTQLRFFAELQGFSRADAIMEADRVLQLVSLADKSRQAPELLSHGMRKRATIAQAFIGEPELVLLDEPTAGLDPSVGKQIRDMIRATADRQTFIISSHNLNEIEDLCGSVAILEKGRLARYAPLAELVERTTSLNFRLEAPAPAAVLDQIRQLRYITRVDASASSGPRLSVYYSETAGDSVQIELLQILHQAGLGFLEMKRGRSLEQKLFESADARSQTGSAHKS